MAVITDADEDWSAGVVLVADEIWQCRGGSVAVATGASAPVSLLDGVELGPPESVFLSSGLTVYYRNLRNSGAIITRTAV